MKKVTEPIVITGDTINGKSVLIAEIPKGKKLEKLNEAQEKHMEKVKAFWLDYIFSCKNQVNRESASIGIEWLYNLAGFERPIMIFLDSPMACQYAVAYLKALVETLPPSGGRFLDQVWSQVGSQVGSQVWSQVWSQVRSQVESQVESQVWSQVESQVGSQVGSQKLSYESFCSYGSVADYGWVSWLDFFQQIGVHNHEGFQQFKNVLLSGVYDMIHLNGFCIVSGLPSELHRDNIDRLHSVNGPSVKFRDGYSQSFIHGVYIEPELFERLLSKEYTFNDWVKEENEEIKSAVLSFMEEKWGSEYLFRFISDHLKEVDTFTDKKPAEYLQGTTGGMNIGVYTLFKGTLNDINLAFVRCYCPSTDRMFFLSVNPSHNNAKDAIASLYRVPAKLKGEIKYIQRQGERFSTVFTKQGNTILSTMNKVDFENLTTISGNEYFSKMKYEY